MIARDFIAAAVVVAGCGAFGLSASCGAGGGNARQERSDVSNESNRQLLELSAHPELEILIRTGTQHWMAGEVTLVVHGSGTVEVTQRQATATASFRGTLSKDEVDAFGRMLHEHRFTAPRTSALPREAGDTPVALALYLDGAVALKVDLWEADRDDDAELGAILRAAEQLVHRVSAGKLGQP
jgi:hypothetical protein